MYRVRAMSLTYQSNAGEVPVMRKWLVRAFFLSLALHLALYVFFRTKKLEHFSTTTERLVPRAFSVQRLDVDSKLLQNQEDEAAPPAAKKPTDFKPIELPDEKPSVDQLSTDARITPVAPELTKPIAMEKPRVEAADLTALSQAQKDSAKDMENDLHSLTKTLLRDSPKVAAQSLLKYTENTGASGGSSDSAAMTSAAGRLNELLGRGLKKGDAPLSLPGGALFEFNSVDLKPEAIDQLRKLGQLIKKSPQVIFSIEGHSDSFGDDETNHALSLQRAESVRAWLVQNMEADPAHIQTKGYGKTRLVVPPAPYDAHTQASIDAEVARQAKNRRVEIVFRFPHAD